MFTPHRKRPPCVSCASSWWSDSVDSHPGVPAIYHRTEREGGGTEPWSISELSLGERLLWLRGALHLDVLQPDLFLDTFVQGWSRSPAPRASPKHRSCGLRAGWYLFSSSCWSPASGFHIHALARHRLCATLMSESGVSER